MLKQRSGPYRAYHVDHSPISKIVPILKNPTSEFRPAPRAGTCLRDGTLRSEPHNAASGFRIFGMHGMSLFGHNRVLVTVAGEPANGIQRLSISERRFTPTSFPPRFRSPRRYSSSASVASE